MQSLEPTDRTRLRRAPVRGSYDRELIRRILDEALFCHVGFVDDGRAVVIPTIHAREGDRLLFHGARRSRLLGALAGPVCVTATLLDGLVLARSALHHSMNYRSVVVFGTAEEVTDQGEKRRCLDRIVEHVVPGRAGEGRPPSDKELARTRVMALPIEEASAKVRSGPPGDDPDDLALQCWAGEVPLVTLPRTPVPAPDLAPGVPPPALERFQRAPR